MTRWTERDDVPTGADYDARWHRLEAQGASIHGEADLVERLVAEMLPAGGAAPQVLDAGCGTGRVAAELARRGFSMVGVDVDPRMLDTARAKAAPVEWVLADLAALDLGREFDAVVMAGNVMIFVAPGTEAQVVARAAAHTRAGGLVIAGFQLGAGRLSLADYDAAARAAGLHPVARYATWEGAPYDDDDGDYAVSVHRRD